MGKYKRAVFILVAFATCSWLVLWFISLQKPELIGASNAQLDALVPDSMKPAPERQADSWPNLLTAIQGLRTSELMGGRWLVGDFMRNRVTLANLAARTEHVPAAVEDLGKYAPPHYPSGFRGDPHDEGWLREPARILSMRMGYLSLTKDQGRLWTSTRALLKYLRLIATVRSTSHAYDLTLRNVAWSCHLMLNDLLDQGVFTPAQMREMLRLIPGPAELIPVHQERIKHDLAAFIDRMRPGTIEKSLSNPGFQIDQFYSGRFDVLRTVTGEIRRAAAISKNLGLPPARRDPSPRLADRARANGMGKLPWPSDPKNPSWTDRAKVAIYRAQRAFNENPMALWFNLRVDAANAYRSSAIDLEYRCVLKAKVACELYQAQYGKPPAALSDLLGVGLTRRDLLDPWDWKPLRYDASRRLVWSVGENKLDDGGNMTTAVGFPDMALSF